MAEYTLPLVGWILYVVVPVVSLGWVTLWYRKRRKKNGSQVEGGESL